MKINIPNYANNKVLVVGDLMLDRYWQGPTSRISPEAPVPIVKVEMVDHKAGGAGNVALNVASLGGQVDLLGYTGDDEAAEVLAECLREYEVNCCFEKIAGRKTITKLRILSRHQQLIRLDFEDGFSSLETDSLQLKFQSLLKDCQAVVLSDYGKGSLQNIPALIAMARAQAVPILIDPKGTDFSIYRQATIITPNQSEFEAVVGPCEDELTLMSKGQALLETLELEALLVTRSEKGMVLFLAGSDPIFVSTHAREVYDVTGAGDTVIAVMAASLACGESLEQATRLANLAAGVVVGKLGTATSSIAELHKAMMVHEPLVRGVTDYGTLLDRVVKAKASGEKIVMTNGCFDILHAGHVAYLSKAAELGDRLIVAVNDDASVRRLKGSDRPINNLMQRMAVLSGLESVDWVVPFSEDTPANLIESIMPDVLVKGGDYKVEQIAGAVVIKNNGGDVVVLDFIDGCSTTAIIESIQKQI